MDDALGRMEREVGRRIAEERGALAQSERALWSRPVSYTHLRAHETVLDLVCRLLLEKKKSQVCIVYQHA